MQTATALREALNQGISSGNFIDTKIVLYSHRAAGLGRVCRPKALYANSHVLKTVPYFDRLLFGDFAESRSKDFEEPIDEGEYVEGYGYLSDSDLEDNEEEKPSPKHPDKPDVRSVEPPVTIEEEKCACEDRYERVGMGKVVKIPDVAFITFQAFLLYLYTNEIEFAPFGSKDNRSAEIANPSDGKVPRPSPKSIYRLADKYDVPTLKNLALNQMRDVMTACDVAKEAFSRFASQYHEVRDMYVRQLAFNWIKKSTAEATRASVRLQIESFVDGDLEHASEVLSILLEMASSDEDIVAPVNIGADSHGISLTQISQWPSVSTRTALIKSIRNGLFFDAKYWARRSTFGDGLKPVYFSNMIMEDKLGKLVKYLKGQNLLTGDFDGDCCVESDCDGDPADVKGELPEKDGSEDQIRAVLITGSFSTWKSLFFYLCTGSISFAPLTSQGADARLKLIRQTTTGTTPPPCSPKSIYALARLLGIQPLCDEALEDIKRKVNLDNVVEEAFSRFTAGEKDIMEMQCDFLVQNLKNPKTISVMNENIKSISTGTSSHCAGALDLVLAKAFRAKKPAKGVKLRCSYIFCSWRKDSIQFSSLGSAVHCRWCNNQYTIECSDCRRTRTENRSSCQGCGREFL